MSAGDAICGGEAGLYALVWVGLSKLSVELKLSGCSMGVPAKRTAVGLEASLWDISQ